MKLQLDSMLAIVKQYHTVVKKRKLTAREMQNIFSLLSWVKSITQPKNPKPIENEAELQYQYSLGKNNSLTIIGEKLFATPGR